MIDFTSRRQAMARRALALSILTILLVSSWSIVVHPLAEMLGADGRGLEERRAELRRLLSATQDRPDASRRLAMLKEAAQVSGLLWTGGQASDLAARMQGTLRNVVSAAGGVVQSTSDLPPTHDSGLVRISVRLDAAVTLRALAVILNQLAVTRPALFLDEIKVNSPVSVSKLNEPLLSVQMELSGYGQS